MRLKQAILGAAAVAAASISLVGAAAAQEYRGYDRGHEFGQSWGGHEDGWRSGRDLDARLDRTAQWIRSLSERGALRPDQVRRTWENFRGIRQQAQYLRSRHGGYLNEWDRRQIESRLDRLTQFLRFAAQNGRD